MDTSCPPKSKICPPLTDKGATPLQMPEGGISAPTDKGASCSPASWWIPRCSCGLRTLSDSAGTCLSSRVPSDSLTLPVLRFAVIKGIPAAIRFPVIKVIKVPRALPHRGRYRDAHVAAGPSPIPPERAGSRVPSDSPQYTSKGYPRADYRESHDSSPPHRGKPRIRHSRKPNGGKRKMKFN